MSGFFLWVVHQVIAAIGHLVGRYAVWCVWCPQFGRWPQLTSWTTVPGSSGMCRECGAEMRRQYGLPTVDVRR